MTANGYSGKPKAIHDIHVSYTITYGGIVLLEPAVVWKCQRDRSAGEVNEREGGVGGSGIRMRDG